MSWGRDSDHRTYGKIFISVQPTSQIERLCITPQHSHTASACQSSLIRTNRLQCILYWFHMRLSDICNHGNTMWTAVDHAVGKEGRCWAPANLEPVVRRGGQMALRRAHVTSALDCERADVMSQALVPVAATSDQPLARVDTDIVKIFPEDELVRGPSPAKEAEAKRTPIKVRRIDSYFKPLTPVREAAPVTDQSQLSAAAPISIDAQTSISSSLLNECSIAPLTSVPTPGPVVPVVPECVASRSSSPDIIIERKIPFIPLSIQRQKTFNRSIQCRGCFKIFCCQVDLKNGVKTCCPHISYYKHCFDCEPYRKLELMMECNNCFSEFLDRNHYEMHLNMGGGRSGQGCRVNAERNFMKHGCKTVLETGSERYFRIPADAGLIKKRSDVSEPVPQAGSPEKPTGVMAIDYGTAFQTSPSASQTTVSGLVRVSKPKKKKKQNAETPDDYLSPDAFTVFAAPPPPNSTQTTVPCEGCGTIFTIFSDQSGNAFGCKGLYAHCIYECPDYRKTLDRNDPDSFPVACLTCKHYFIDRHQFTDHKATCKL